MLIDTGSSVTVIDKTTFQKLKEQNPNLTLQKTKTKLFPYGTNAPLPLMGKFQTTLETKTKYAVCDVFVINKHDYEGEFGS